MRPPTADELGLSPARRVAALVAEIGERGVARMCGDVLAGDRDDAAVLWLAGKPATSWRYEPWPRTWALRGLLYAWDDTVSDSVVDALTDDAWRVQEMAAKVVRRRALPSYHVLDGLLRAPEPRVRIAALRALAVVGEGESAEPMRALLDDPAAGDAAAAALVELGQRLDRAL